MDHINEPFDNSLLQHCANSNNTIPFKSKFSGYSKLDSQSLHPNNEDRSYFKPFSKVFCIVYKSIWNVQEKFTHKKSDPMIME